jgi:hypothetical protein
MKKYPTSTVLCKRTTHRIVENLHVTGSVLDKHKLYFSQYEAQFILYRKVKSPNNRYWHSENPH